MAEHARDQFRNEDDTELEFDAIYHMLRWMRSNAVTKDERFIKRGNSMRAFTQLKLLLKDDFKVHQGVHDFKKQSDVTDYLVYLAPKQKGK